MENIIKYTIISLLVFGSTSCKKDWLDQKRDMNIVVPTTLKDMRLLLNNDIVFSYDTRGITEVSTDDASVTDVFYNSISRKEEKNALIWAKDIYESSPVVREWDNAYSQVMYANVVLEAIQKLNRTIDNAKEYDDIKGSALFYRSRAFLNLVMTFSNYYNSATALQDAGIPLKLSADINEKISRASVQQVYDRIILDLREASNLLPAKVNSKLNPCRAAALGLLARCFLFMDNYELALDAADKSFELQPELLDYNTLNITAAYPIPTLNEEIHITGTLFGAYATFRSGNIEQAIYDLFDADDLRREIFFNGEDKAITFGGSYNGIASFFSGTATDEMLLIRAECKARLDNFNGGLEDLNLLLSKRYKTGTFSPKIATTKKDAINLILLERRKELMRRGLRWQDLRRLNRQAESAKTLARTINGVTYTLLPNDPKYIFPIPMYVITQSNLSQNPR